MSEVMMSDVLNQLQATIEARRGQDVTQSHTAAMLAKGPQKCAQKFGEEAVEAVIAAAIGDRKELISEGADTLYHFLVMLSASNVELDEVLAELQRRRGVSGIAEKASRTK
ncbi:MAG: phosphoribosyl-ATP diphosphatase [Pikeienuella sp.]